jgi:hypothetical protein
MSVALGGNLRDFGIAEIFQLIGQQRKTGILEISDGSQNMQLAFDAGAVVWASPAGTSEHSVLGERVVRAGFMPTSQLDSLMQESETSARPLPTLLTTSGALSQLELQDLQDLLTKETIFEVLRWSDGTFHFSAQPIRHRKTQEELLGADQILMDGLRMIDEWRTFSSRVPSEDTVFERCAPIEAYRQRASGSARERLAHAERIYQLIDGRLSVRRVIDLSRLGTFDATRVLAEMVDEEAIRASEVETRLSASRTSMHLRPTVEQVGAVFAAALPMALLCLMVSLAFGLWNGPAEQRPGFPIVRHPLEEARSAFEKRRLQNAAYVHRILTGKWPESLTAEPEVDLPSAYALTPADGEPYYYARSESGIILLAPER